MSDYNRCNKKSGIYWLSKSLNDLKITIKLKSQDGIMSLPKFEEYTQGSSRLNLDNNAEEYVFKWQEKIFSCWEVQRFTDHHNCITDTELKYHEDIKKIRYKPGKIFTYVQEDHYLPLPNESNKNNDVLKLNSYLELLNLNDPITRVFGGDTISTTNLFKSQENLNLEQAEWMTMHVVYDNSDYNEDSQLIYKQEVTLLSLYHNISQNYLIISPDVNNLELNPYSVETPSGVQWGYQYAIEVEFDNVEQGDELVMLLNKLHNRWKRKHKRLLIFHLPALGKKQCYITLEIMQAKEFEMDNVYIEFDVKLPEGLHSEDSLHGCTHTSIANNDEWHFGHILEFTVETLSGIDPTPLMLFFEVISSDWWGRHRTEGYAYLPMTLDPGCYTKKLSCKRPEELDSVTANSRRFFVGGCHLLKDLNVLVEPQTKEMNFSNTTTGTILLRWNIVSQSQIGNLSTTMEVPIGSGVNTASALLQGAEAALQRYKKARARLAAATKQLGDTSKVTGDG